MTQRRFPNDFVWGVATSAAQIEGSVAAEGRGASIWDRFAATAGNIRDGSNPSVACDHYRRWREDVKLLRWLGVGAYRFSIAWSRVFPEGRGAVCKAGLDFYERLVDALLQSDIQPFVTLHHWDLPASLQDRGGWAARDTVDAFVDYTAAVSERLGDRVRYWTTHNEPWCMTTLGYEQGEHAPGHRDPAAALRVAHHLLLSHGHAVDVLRQQSPQSEVGIVLNLTPGQPVSASEADREATRQFDGSFNRWYLDPLFRGQYPADAVQDRVRLGHLESDAPSFVHSGDLDVIARPIDFLGLNYYTRVVLKAGSNGAPEAVSVVPREQATDMGWEVYPEGLETLLVRLRDEYRLPKIYITENGAAYADEPDGSGRVDDVRRVDYMRAHLESMHRALTAEVPVAGYFAWSLLDNFEWSHGYSKRFGLVWVDYATQKRIPKRSAHWYRVLTAANALGQTGRQAVPRRFL